jgi:hypothetical protein
LAAIVFFGGIGPFDIMPGEKKDHFTRIPGGAEIYVKWDTIKGAFRNTITKFCPRKDTTRFEIKL